MWNMRVVAPFVCAVILCVGLAVTLTLYLQEVHRNHSDIKVALASEAEKIVDAFKSGLATSAKTPELFSVMLGLNPSLTQEQFNDVSVVVRHSFPGLSVLGYNQLVQEADRAEWEARMSNLCNTTVYALDGNGDVSSVRPSYLLGEFRNPVQQGLFRDLFQTSYAHILDETLAGPPGVFRASGLHPIYNGAAGYVIFNHVVDAKVNATAGVSLFAYQASAFLQGALPFSTNGLQLAISDVSAPDAPALLYTTVNSGINSSDPDSPTYVPAPLSFPSSGSHIVVVPLERIYNVVNWSLTFTTTPAFEHANSSHRQATILGMGLAITLFCACVFPWLVYTWWRSARATAAASEARIAKDTFSQTLGIVCHELRNPAHALLGTLTLLTEEKGRSEELVLALSSVHTIRSVLDDILEMQRHGTRLMTPRPSPTDLMSIVRDVTNRTRNDMRETVQFYVVTKNSLPQYDLMLDQLHLRMLLGNAIHHACRVTVRGEIIFFASAFSATSTGGPSEQLWLQFAVLFTGDVLPEDAFSVMTPSAEGLIDPTSLARHVEDTRLHTLNVADISPSTYNVMQVSRIGHGVGRSEYTSGLLRAMGQYDRVGLPVCRDIIALMQGAGGLLSDDSIALPRDPKAAGSRFECVKLKSPCSRGHHHNTPERVGRFWVAFPVLAAKNTGATSAVTVTLPAGQASASDYPSLRAAAHSEAREPDSEKPVGWPSGNSISSVSPPSILLMRTEDSDRAEHSLGHGQCDLPVPIGVTAPLPVQSAAIERELESTCCSAARHWRHGDSVPAAEFGPAPESDGGDLGELRVKQVAGAEGPVTKLAPSPPSQPQAPTLLHTDSAHSEQPRAVTIAPLGAFSNSSESPALPVLAAPGKCDSEASDVYYVVDDEKVNLRVASRFLKMAGVAFQTFDDGVMLPKPPLPEHCCCVLLDIVMKRSDGVQVCRELRAGGCTIPIIAMTGNVTDESVKQYRESGFNGVLGKPFTVADIRAVVAFCREYDPDRFPPLWFSNLN